MNALTFEDYRQMSDYIRRDRFKQMMFTTE